MGGGRHREECEADVPACEDHAPANGHQTIERRTTAIRWRAEKDDEQTRGKL